MQRIFAFFCVATLLSTGTAYAVTFVFINNNSGSQPEHFVSSAPKNHQSLDTSPDTVSVAFSGAIAAAGSSLNVYDLYGTEVTDGTVTVNGTAMSAKLPQLASGKYTVKWETYGLSSNAKLSGEFHFFVR